jgi:hypothetical protein
MNRIIPEMLYPNLTPLNDSCGWAEVGHEQIILVEVHHHDRQTIDAWMDLSAGIRQEWPEDKPLLLLVDMTTTNFSFTPYVMKRVEDMMAIRDYLDSYIALVIQPSLTGRLVETTARTAHWGNAMTHASFTREDAFAWLMDKHAAFFQQKRRGA